MRASLPRSLAFNRRLNPVWLREALTLQAAELPTKEWLERMESLIRAENPGKDSTQKSLRYLRHMWLEPKPEIEPLRKLAVDLRRQGLSADEETVVVWGLALATYPYLLTLSNSVGRLLTLQETFKLEQFLRRMSEEFGAKESACRSGRYALTLMVDLGLLHKPGTAGIYAAARKLNQISPSVATFLIRCLFLASQQTAMDRSAFLGWYALFPFDAALLLQAALNQAAVSLKRPGPGRELFELSAY